MYAKHFNLQFMKGISWQSCIQEQGPESKGSKKLKKSLSIESCKNLLSTIHSSKCQLLPAHWIRWSSIICFTKKNLKAIRYPWLYCSWWTWALVMSTKYTYLVRKALDFAWVSKEAFPLSPSPVLVYSAHILKKITINYICSLSAYF